MQDFCCGVAGDDGDGYNVAAGGFHFFTADDLIAGPVAAFDEDVWEQGGDDALGSEGVEDEHSVNALESGEDFGALEFGDEGSALTFQLADAGVAVDGDEESVTEGAGLLEGADVAGMEKVETAVGEDEFESVAFVASKSRNC